jgi:hypothetical protein
LLPINTVYTVVSLSLSIFSCFSFKIYTTTKYKETNKQTNKQAEDDNFCIKSQTLTSASFHVVQDSFICERISLTFLVERKVLSTRMFYRSLTVASFLASLIPLAASFSLGEDLIELSLRAVELAAAVQTQEPNAVAGSNFYIDGPNAALFVREGDYCFIVFDSTKPTAEDWWQNLDPSFNDICSSSGDCCEARAGFVQAYTSSSYKDTLEADMRLCMYTCPQCEAVLMGHSQGGAVALVAAIAMADIKPTIITFGQPASIVGSCPPIDVEKNYRFVNTVEDAQGTLDYDPVSYLNLSADHMGKLFIMGNDDENVVYYGDGNGPNPVSFGSEFNAHEISDYVNRLLSYQGKGEIGTSGWRMGFSCNVNEECMDKSCVYGWCHRGDDGDPCNRDNDCDSGRCEGYSSYVWSGTCRPKLDVGAGCDENSDCTTNQCRNTWMQPWSFKCSL